jgi:hypothetical protein
MFLPALALCFASVLPLLQDLHQLLQAGLGKLPMEMLFRIGENVTGETAKNLRLVSHRFNAAFTPAFVLKVVEEKKLYPTPESAASWFALLATNFADTILKFTVIGETFREHPYGYAWAWEQSHNNADHDPTAEDWPIISDINISHSEVASRTHEYVTSGTYRRDLISIVQGLHNLARINLQFKLAPGEHIPGWVGSSLLPGVSGLEKLDIHDIFYGNWKYDERHNKVTCYVDEFGEECQLVEDVGPQAGFWEDLQAAKAWLEACGVSVVHGFELGN